MNKQEQRTLDIIAHGERLRRVFRLDTDPLPLCKKLHRIEVSAHRYAEQLCNGELDWTDDQQAMVTASLLRSVDNATLYKSINIPVFINWDPRGLMPAVYQQESCSRGGLIAEQQHNCSTSRFDKPSRSL